MAGLFGGGNKITGTVDSDGNLNVTGTTSEGEVFGGDGTINVVAESRGEPGTPGVNGKGWSSASYNENTGIVTFISSDGLSFDTGDLRGTSGQNGETNVQSDYTETDTTSDSYIKNKPTTSSGGTSQYQAFRTINGSTLQWDDDVTDVAARISEGWTIISGLTTDTFDVSDLKLRRTN